MVVNPKAYPLASAEVRALVPAAVGCQHANQLLANTALYAAIQHYSGHRAASCELPTAEEGRERRYDCCT